MSLHQEMIADYYTYHKKLMGFEPLKFSKVDAKKIKDIKTTLLNSESGNEEATQFVWRGILNHLYKNRNGTQKWLAIQPLSVIESRINQIIGEIKNARNTENELARIASWDGK